MTNPKERWAQELVDNLNWNVLNVHYEKTRIWKNLNS
jgi:hypothetical protein